MLIRWTGYDLRLTEAGDGGMAVNNRQIGLLYEKKAAEYLKSIGYSIEEMNFRTRQAEADIVARDRETLVFVEVKYRTDSSVGNPLEAVNHFKQLKISRAAVSYMNRNNISVYDTAVRFDVIGIEGNILTHIRNAFPYTDIRR